MKKTTIILSLVFIASVAFSQENMITLSGGYVLSNVEDTDVNATGFRINALYEYNQAGGRWAQGFSVGYMSLSATAADTRQTTTYDFNTWPIYYQPKYLFGGENFKGFIKGAIGWQISHIDRTTSLSTISDKDSGFVGGGGVGAQYHFNKKIFLTAEYELLWMSNSFYKDGLLNTVSLGLGFKF